jgi:putative membrane protein
MKNLKLFSAMILLFSTSLFIQSCNDDDDQVDYKMDNQVFVNQASSSNNFEVAAGNLASTKGQSQLVKQYGQHMVTDHTAVGAEMTALAATKGWTVPAPTDLQPKEKALLNTLDSVTNETFDMQFAAIMIASHEDAISLFEDASGREGVRDADLRNFAANKLPALRTHLEEAKTLQSQIQ